MIDSQRAGTRPAAQRQQTDQQKTAAEKMLKKPLALLPTLSYFSQTRTNNLILDYKLDFLTAPKSTSIHYKTDKHKAIHSEMIPRATLNTNNAFKFKCHSFLCILLNTQEPIRFNPKM